MSAVPQEPHSPLPIIVLGHLAPFKAFTNTAVVVDQRSRVLDLAQRATAGADILGAKITIHLLSKPTEPSNHVRMITGHVTRFPDVRFQVVEFTLVNRLAPAEKFRECVDHCVRTLQGKSPIALSRALEAVISGGECAQSEALRLEASLFGLCFATEDMREGTRAFLEKRKPAFSGR